MIGVIGNCFEGYGAFFPRYQFRNARRVGLQELGPRFTLRPRYLQKGTFDSKNGEYYWIFKVEYVFFSYVLLCIVFIKNHLYCCFTCVSCNVILLLDV